MAKFMTNEEVLKMFGTIEELEQSDLPKETIDKKVKEIKDRIVEGLSFLVYTNTKGYRSFPNYEDLVQEGFFGLINAVRKFDTKLFPNFFVYAERGIRRSVKRAASKFDIVYNPDKTRVIYAEPADLGEEPEVQDVPEQIFFAKEQKEKIEKILSDFPDRDREIVEHIFGIGNNYPPKTLREIGPIFDLTHERVRQIKNRVIDKLRKNKMIEELR